MGREIYNIVRAKITTDDFQAFETQAQEMKAAAKKRNQERLSMTFSLIARQKTY